MIRELDIFRQIVISGGFKKAADPLGITPGAVTQALKRLERDLGVVLIQRSTRSFRVTSEGEELFSSINDGFSKIRQTVRDIQKKQGQDSGYIRMSCVQSYYLWRLSSLVSDFQKNHPNIVVESDLSDTPANLIEEGLDLGIRMGKFPDSDLIFKKLETLEVILCASPNYLKNSAKISSSADLTIHKTIGFKIPRTKQTYPWQFYEEKGWITLKLSHVAYSNAIEAVLAMSADGLGIALTPKYLAEHYLKAGQLVEVLPRLRKKSVDTFICLPRREGRSKRVDSLVKQLMEVRAKP